MTPDAIRFQAQIFKVQTLVDGGIRVTLDMAETEINAAMKLIQARQAGALLEVAAVAVEPDKKQIWQDQRN
jgi:hypothetical protein